MMTAEQAAHLIELFRRDRTDVPTISPREPTRAYIAAALVAVVLAFAAPYAAAEDAKLQADYHARGNVDLMAAFERLRMLDEIGAVTVVKIQPGQFPESADIQSDKMRGAGASDTADAAGEIESDAADRQSEKMDAEAAAVVDERIASAFEVSGAEPGPAGANNELARGKQTAEVDLHHESANMTGADTLGAAADQPPSGDQAEAGATGNTTDNSGELGADAGRQQHPDADEAADAVSTTFIEETLNQIPEIKHALEENHAQAADIVGIDFDENGEVTIFVRES